MRKKYIIPSALVRFVVLTNLMDQSIPISGSTDDTQPRESKHYFPSFDESVNEE